MFFVFICLIFLVEYWSSYKIKYIVMEERGGIQSFFPNYSLFDPAPVEDLVSF